MVSTTMAGYDARSDAMEDLKHAFKYAAERTFERGTGAPQDTVWVRVIWTHASKSGMTKRFKLFVNAVEGPRDITGHVAVAFNLAKFHGDQGFEIVALGAGMDVSVPVLQMLGAAFDTKAWEREAGVARFRVRGRSW